MSSFKTDESLTLDIEAEDSATEIFVISGEWQLEDRGVGHLLTKPLPPGIYKIKTRTAGVTQEQYLILRQTGQKVTIPSAAFVSPAPLDQTLTKHEYHEGAAETESKKIHVPVGSGSNIFVFSRKWSTERTKSPTSSNPALGLCIRDAFGMVLANLETASKTGDEDRDAWAACNVQLNPGVYRLSLDLPSGGRLEQAIVACQGWQTQIFLLARDYGPDSDSWRAGPATAPIQTTQYLRGDLPGGSILMAPLGTGFASGDPGCRMAELARLGLTNRRKVLSSQLDQILDGKFGNPMLGIYGAHLLLLNKQPDMNLLRTVIGNLRLLVGTTHPDVEALALAADMGSIPFSSPPMLKRSWSLVLNATISQPYLVPVDSWAANASESLWGEEPWLLWTVDTQILPKSRSEDLKNAIKNYFSDASPASQTKRLESRFAAINSMRQINPFIASQAAAIESFIEPAQRKTKDIKFLVENLKLPRSNVEEMLRNIDNDQPNVVIMHKKA